MRIYMYLLVLLLLNTSCDQHPWGYYPKMFVHADISSDGWLAYMYYIENSFDDPTLCMMNLKTQEVHKLYDVKAGQTCYPKWSKDGSRILFTDGILYLKNRKVVGFKSNIDLNLKCFAYVTWSPDEKSILFGCDGNLFVCDTTFNNLQQLPMEGVAPNWLPNGNEIIYSHNNQIIIYNLQNEIEKVLLPSTNTDSNLMPVCSPNGEKVAWIRNGVICIIDMVSLNRIELGEGGNPAWSADSKYIYYDTTDSYKPFESHIWKVNVETREKNVLTK